MVWLVCPLSGCEFIPFFIEIHPYLVFLLRFVLLAGRYFFQFELILNPGQKLFFAKTVKIFDYPVVIHYLQLLVREDYSQEEIVFLISGMVMIGISSHLTYFVSRGGTVMSISNIKSRNLCKTLDYPFYDLRITDLPEGMYDGIVCLEMILRVLTDEFHYQIVDRIYCRISKKDRSGIGIESIHVIDTVLLFISTRKLVFLDNIFLIIVNRSTRYQSDLFMVAHLLLIEIE